MCAAAILSDDGLRPYLSLTSLKNGLLAPVQSTTEGTLSPDVKGPGFGPDLLSKSSSSSSSLPECIGSYLLLEKVSSIGIIEIYKSVHTGTLQEFTCKVFPLNKYYEALAPYWRSGFHRHITEISEIVLGATRAYVFFHRAQEDLHSYIRRKRRLHEPEAAGLFRQIVAAIKHCHKRGIVLRDLKLRKFMFIDQERRHLVLDGLEDAFLLDDSDNDHLTDKHGCPAYVSPEILSSHGYSGRSADMWSVGVILYTMLFGQYPFHDTVASQLFGKIRRGYYTVPDSVSPQARCLVKSLLRTEPTERLTVFEAVKHPWFELCKTSHTVSPSLALAAKSTVNNNLKELEQRVPEFFENRPLDDMAFQ